MIPPSFQNQVEMTFIGTATAILNINGVRFITDPVFNAAGTEYEEPTITFKVLTGPALQPHDLPAIDAVLPVLPAPEGLPNAIYISGDTVYLEELAEMRKKFHIVLAVLNLGDVLILLPGKPEPVQITLGSNSAAKLIREIEPDVVVPMHFDSWAHFAGPSTQAAKVFEEEGLKGKVLWLAPGVATRVL